MTALFSLGTPNSLALRFIASPQRITSLQRKLHVLTGATPAVSKHNQLFYDTPGARIQRAGFDLRLERHEGHWLQFLRQRVSGQEWPVPYHGGFDFSTCNDPAVAVLNKPKRLNQLNRIFEVRLRRTRWSGAAVQVVLERGTVSAGERSAPFARLLISRPDGDQKQRFDLAAALSEHLALLPDDDDVVTRGYALHAGLARVPVKTAALDLAEDSSARAAFAHISLSCLQHWMANRDGAVQSPDDPEYVHQLRVAIRRQRAAIQIFRAVLPDEFLSAVLPPLRELMASLGRSRDLDVLMEEIVTPVVLALPDEPRLQALNKRLSERLLETRREACAQLDRPALGGDLLRIMRRLDQLQEEVAMPAEDNLSLREFVDKRLRKRLRAAQHCANVACNDDPVSLHELRIAIKRLRYSLEFFSSLLPKGTARDVLHKLAVLQEELGQLNDLASAGALLMANAGDEAVLREAVTLIAGWHGARYAALLADIPHHLKAVRRLRLPRLSAKVKTPGKIRSVNDAAALIALSD